ncbi:MAG: hypothetical protein ABIH23_36035 [bacterium]
MMKRFAVLLLGVGLLVPAAAWAASKAGLVIENSTGEVITRCVEFEEESITVLDLLQRSGFKLVTGEESGESRVCYLHDDGRSDCTSIPGGLIWSGYQHSGTDWTSLSLGVSSDMATDGVLFGFVCEPGGLPPTARRKPPARSFADVCDVVSKAGLVIDHSDGARLVKVIEFPGETITGWQLLQRSGLDITSSDFGFGIAICAIDGEGMPAENCFGDPEGRFWNFNILLSDGTWVSSWVGASDTIVYDGDAHGYLYGVWGVVQPAIEITEIFGQTSDVSFWKSYAR